MSKMIICADSSLYLGTSTGEVLHYFQDPTSVCFHFTRLLLIRRVFILNVIRARLVTCLLLGKWFTHHGHTPSPEFSFCQQYPKLWFCRIIQLPSSHCQNSRLCVLGGLGKSTRCLWILIKFPGIRTTRF